MGLGHHSHVYWKIRVIGTNKIEYLKSTMYAKIFKIWPAVLGGGFYFLQIRITWTILLKGLPKTIYVDLSVCKKKIFKYFIHTWTEKITPLCGGHMFWQIRIVRTILVEVSLWPFALYCFQIRPIVLEKRMVYVFSLYSTGKTILAQWIWISESSSWVGNSLLPMLSYPGCHMCDIL